MSVAQWWFMAVVSGVALGLAMMSMTTTTRQKIGSFAVPLAVAAAVVGQSAARGFDGRAPLFLFTLIALSLTASRIIFAAYVSRQLDFKRSGEPMEEMTGKQTAIFLLTLLAVLILVGFLIG